MSIKDSNKTPFSSQLNSNCHTFVTDLCHTYNIQFTPRELKFIETAYDKHHLTGEYFSSHDFPHLTPNNFSQIVHRINKKYDLILKQVGGRSPMFSLKGFYLDQPVREKGTGVNTPFINQKIAQLYNLAKKQPPQMHDIKLSSRTSQLYSNLLLQPDLSIHTKNKQFVIPILANPRFDSKAQISQNGRLDLHIGCSQNPLFCSIEGFTELAEYIGEVKHFLSIRAGSRFISEPSHKWIFQYYHFNRDTEPIIDSTYKFSIGQHNAYVYIKKFDNDTIKGRYEEKRNSKRTVLEEQEKVIESL
ncbi:hypothetical protein [Nitrosarchaeum sp.]|uniref:hypothetical protein n=1 Tax=Nitrosarchaeum sp. TaxID=2026886 RepID=UPI00247ED49C|nr:hypothetical protein [Nitrosarchaeum sp.]MCV0411396.1 hypothetical protein [Nitrosarchaeum sp.]